jgi:hypothetical protein
MFANAVRMLLKMGIVSPSTEKQNASFKERGILLCNDMSRTSVS